MSLHAFFVHCVLLFGFTMNAQNNKPGIEDTTTSFKVFGVCEQCKHRIETSLKVRGVKSADWNIDTKMLTVTYEPNKISFEKLNDRIAAVGHDTYFKKARDKDYFALPKCCYYRELDSMGKTVSVIYDLAIDSISADVTNKMVVERVVKGVVMEEDKAGTFKPLVGASVLWLGTNKGTVTDENGAFMMKQTAERLIISYTGFQSDTISVLPTQEIRVVLASGNTLKEVRVTTMRHGSYINPLDPMRTANISQKELFKAACCNLSESFETNPSVDVSYNDAITGSKQIQLLGLAGVYTQLTVENLPGPRGLATSLGLNSIAGPWIESLQLSKGTGSVANGFESIAGQINVELKKPATSEKFYANIYLNDFGKSDLNLNYAPRIGKKWSTILLLHDDFLENKTLDFNHDGFRDLPTGNLFSAVNKWSFDNSKGFMIQFGLKYLTDDRTGGQVNYDASKDKFTTNSYGLGINTRRVEGFGKIGYVFPEKKYKSVGLQLSAFDHQQDSYFGLTKYNGHQKNFYSNLIYQSIIHTTANKFRTGISLLYDNYDETYKTAAYKRIESVPGVFFEYTFSPSDKFDLVAGIREDHNNLYGWFTTPRLNVRYEPIKGTVIRGSVGRGQRTANIFAENNGVFVSSRAVNIIATDPGGAYGLKPEISWNKGISIDQKLNAFSRAASLGIDFYRNDFVNQVIVDLEDPRQIKFYNLQGKSYSNSLQAEFSFIPVQNLDVKIAYRLFDVKATYGNQLLQRPLIARDRAFVNLGYEVKGWKLDYTITYDGKKRLPPTQVNPPLYQRATESPSFLMMNAQVSKTIGKKNSLEFYIGGENLTGYIQRDAIIAANRPFSQYFDASLIWGSVVGRMVYGGFRYKIK